MSNTLKNIAFLTLAAISLLGLSACASVDETAPVAVNAPHGNVEKQRLYHYLLNEQGIDIVKIGETQTIVIPSDQLFQTSSANLNKSYTKTLKIIAQFINSYDVTSVTVNAYTNQSGEIAKALTEKQAQAIVNFISEYGADTRLLVAKGYGNLYPVTRDEEKSNLNRRIEIKFQFHAAERIY